MTLAICWTFQYTEDKELLQGVYSPVYQDFTRPSNKTKLDSQDFYRPGKVTLKNKILKNKLQKLQKKKISYQFSQI